MYLSSIFRSGILALSLAALSACAGPGTLDGPLAPMGDFRLGHNVVVDTDATVGPLSRKADPGEWEAVMKDEIEKRFGGYTGGGLYHIGVKIDGYVLAVPGIPLVASPKSVLIISANVWDNSTQKKLHAEPKRLTLLEEISGTTLIGSGLTQSKEVQMRRLARNATNSMQKWMLENPDWFADVGKKSSSSQQSTTSAK